jgi:flavin-dependent dehydrogenase
MRDLLVVGGGPIGLATALYAKRSGLDVVVREPRRGVIDKACGEGLMPSAVASLTDLGVPVTGRPISGIRYVAGPRAVESTFRSGPGRGVRRTELHAALRTAVDAAGVPVEDIVVRRVEPRADHVLVDDEPVRHVVAADGLHSMVRRRLGLDAPTRAGRRFGLRCHVSVAPWSRFVEVHWSRLGEAYVTPVGDGEVGVAVLTDRPGDFEVLLATFPVLADRLGDATRSRVRGAGPLRQRSRHRVEGRVLLVGDAAGYVDALTGEGIAVGLAQARAAVDAIASGEPQRYERDWRRVTWRHDLLTHTLLAATRHRALRDRIVPAAATLPRVFDAAVNQLARPA